MKNLQHFIKAIGSVITFICLLLAAYSASGVALWVAYILSREVLQLGDRHAILLALLPLLWIQIATDRLKQD